MECGATAAIAREVEALDVGRFIPGGRSLNLKRRSRPARPSVLRGGQRIKRVDLCGNGAEADGFFGGAHNARTITCIIVYYKTSPTLDN
jgi:hypothetical protein